MAIWSGYHRSYGTQVDWHRDGRNARIIASAFFSGMDFEGGELILAYLEYAFHAGPGYSVHGCYDILIHGIGQIRSASPKDNKPPIRISLAMYPQANVYAGAARFSAALKGGNTFSDSDLWLPFYPANFEAETATSVLAAEKKRLYNKYRDEVLAHKGLPPLPRKKVDKEDKEET